jgi:hypothetical protein
VRNGHGQREPWQTDAWVATTWHLFEAALGACDSGTNAEAAACLRELRDLVHEVDEHCDELVTFEDSGAQDAFHAALTGAARHLGAD